MHQLLGGLRNLLKIQKVHIDGNIFRLNTKISVVFLLAFCMLLTAREYVGSPIDCLGSSLPSSVVNSFCWIESTYSVTTLLNASGPDNIVAYPGVGSVKSEVSQRKYHTYYQWVCFLLFCQAVFFYVPRWLWKMWENGKVEAIVSALDVKSAIFQEQREARNSLVDFLVLNLRRNNVYFTRYFCCEIACVANVILQMVITNWVLGGGFYTYGSDVVNWYRQDKQTTVSPMVRAFPRLTKCSFWKFGDSGTLENREAICVLPLNILNEKIFLFLWFWYVILLILGVLVVIYRIVVCVHVPLRYGLLQVRFPHAPTLSSVVKHVSMGDVFMLSLIGQNVDSLVFSDIIRELSRRVVKEPLGDGESARQYVGCTPANRV
ncbi:innexin shaking-B-like [Ornithodoros turicata]|uniref:innexin shaking-B-like n=1 Tax=Ornithodoros turicata TaxID=34597 RepID=UPI003138B837